MPLNKLSKNHCTIETNSGILTVSIKEATIFMEQIKPVFYEILQPNELSDCFDITAIDSKYPIQIASIGLKDILIPIKSETQLHNLEPNFEKIKEISEKYNVVGTHLYALKEGKIRCRNFALLYNINEEATTGTLNGALAPAIFMKSSM